MLTPSSPYSRPWLPSPVDLIQREAEYTRQKAMGHAYRQQLSALGQQSQSPQFKTLIDLKV